MSKQSGSNESSESLNYLGALEQKISLSTIAKLKARGEKFTCIALYDAAMSNIAETAGVETLLVGDSLGMTVQGHQDTVPVTVQDIIYHTRAVARGNNKSLLIADMPFMSYANPQQALDNATLLMQAGAQMVKVEGGEWLAETIKLLSDRGIPVCGHLGLTPQSVNKLGGFKVQGKSEAEAEAIYQDALLLEKCGADLLVLECIPATLAKRISDALTHCATIGIGAGKDTDAQVLVINDMIGLTPRPPKFSKNFLPGVATIPEAVSEYVRAVKSGEFPGEEQTF